MASLIRRRPSVLAGPSRLAQRVQTARQIRALRASASRIEIGNRHETKMLQAVRQGWQDRAWSYLDTLGELRYATAYQGNAARRMLAFPGVYMPGQLIPVPVGDSDLARYESVCDDALDRLGDVGGRGALLRDVMVNFEVVGEAYLVGRTDQSGGVKREIWEIRSTSEVVTLEDGQIALRDMPGSGAGWVDPNSVDIYLLQDDDFISRLWWPHPRWRKLADSPVHAAENILEELQILSADIRAAGVSRLANNGMWLIPDELTVARAAANDEDSGYGMDDPFLGELIQAATEAIADPGSAAAAVPIVARGPADALKEVRLLTFARPEADNANKRAECQRRLATALDLPAEVLTGLADLNHWCFDAETEVLTERGWVGHESIRIGDVALSLNHDTGLSQWQPVVGLYRADVVDEPMTSVENRMHSSLTTPHHRWPVLRRVGRDNRQVRAWTTSAELRRSDNLITACPCADLPVEPKWADSFVELVAQEPNRVVRREFVRELTASQLDLFITTSVRADGSVMTGGSRWVGQHPEAFELAVILSGRSVHTHATRPGISVRERTSISLRRNPTEIVRYSGVVWCPTVTPNHTVLARRHGHVCYTGQTAWNVDDSTFRSHIEPTMWVIVDALTAGYFRQYITEAGVTPEDAARMVVWYDPTELLTKPDKTQDAKDAYGEAVLSAEAFRRHLGFTEDEAPDGPEKVERLLMRTRTLDPGLVIALARRLDPELEEIIEPAPGGTIGGPERVEQPPPAEPGAETPTEGPPPQTGPPTAPPEPPHAAAADLRHRVDLLQQARANRVARMARTKEPPVGWATTVSRRLVQRDALLRESLRASAEAAVRRVLERAGARVVTRARQKDRLAADLCAGVPLHEVPARLGPTLVAALGLTEDALLVGELGDLEKTWNTTVSCGQRQAIELSCRLIVAEPADILARLARKLDQDRADGWQLLRSELDRRTRQALTAAAEDDDTAQLVPPGAIRAALAIAGGFLIATSAGISTDTLRPADPTEFYGGIGNGPTVTSVLRAGGASVERYEWHHGMATNPYPPHEDLDGYQFTSWDDPALMSGGAFGPMRPGDHKGCSCDAILIWVPAEEAALAGP